jgi:hypothetical protein
MVPGHHALGWSRACTFLAGAYTTPTEYGKGYLIPIATSYEFKAPPCGLYKYYALITLGRLQHACMGCWAPHAVSWLRQYHPLALLIHWLMPSDSRESLRILPSFIANQLGHCIIRVVSSVVRHQPLLVFICMMVPRTILGKPKDLPSPMITRRAALSSQLTHSSSITPSIYLSRGYPHVVRHGPVQSHPLS